MKWTCVVCQNSKHAAVRPQLCICGATSSFAHTENELPSAYERATDKPTKPRRRLSTGQLELDAALGGGIPVGTTLMFWGKGGSGKSRSALRIGTHLGQCLCVSLEMSKDDCIETARSSGAKLDHLLITRDENAPLPGRIVRCIVWDSISRTIEADAALVRLEAWAKQTGGVVLLICHANKAGDYRGPSTLQHWPDAELTFRASAKQKGMSRVRVKKSRFCECPAVAHVPIV